MAYSATQADRASRRFESALLLMLIIYLAVAGLWWFSQDPAFSGGYLSVAQAAALHQTLGWLLPLFAILLPLVLFWQVRAKALFAKQVQQKLASTFDEAAVGLAHVAVSRHFIQVNQRFAQMLQYEPADLAGSTFQDLTHPDDLADDLQLCDALVRGERESFEMEKRYRRRDGLFIWAHLSVSFHRSPDPQQCYFVSVIEDINARKQALMALQASMAQVQLLLDATGDAIIGLNRNAEITFVNQAAQQQLGYANISQLIGLPLQTLVSKQKAALALWREIYKALEQPQQISGEADLFINLQGDTLPTAYRAIPVPRSQDGTVLVICWQNIRERKQQQMKQQAQSYLLHRLLDDAALPDLLTELVKFIEQQLPHLRGSILLADLPNQVMRVAAGPSLPAEYNNKVDGLPIRYGNGSCGTAAATGQPVYVADVHNDMLWLNFQDLIAPYDWLQACWSTPFFDTQRQLLGTFGIYLAEKRDPTPEERDLIQFTASLAAFLVERSDAKARLELFSKAIEQSPVGVVICGINGEIQYFNQRFIKLSCIPAALLDELPPLKDILPDDQQEWLDSVLPQLKAGHQKVSRQDQRLLADNTALWLESSLYAIVDRKDQVTHVLLELEDITMQKQAEQHWIESELRFRTLLDNTPEISVQGYEADGTTFYWNKASEVLYGYSKEEALGKSLLDLIIPTPMRQDVSAAVRAMAESGVPLPAGELMLQRKGGEPVQVFSGHAVVQLPGRPSQIFCMDIDLSVRKQQEANLRLADAVFNSSREGILITDIDKVIISVNPALVRLFGYSDTELVGQKPAILRSGQHSDEFYQQMWQQLREQNYWQGEVFNKHKDGSVLPVQLSISAVFNETQQISHYAAVFTDLSEIRATEAEMMFLSEHDELTHLPNRQLFLQLVEQALKTARRDQLFCAVLVLDLDHFKDVNDSYGHRYGDELLLQVASRLKQKVRDIDVVARLGGDEFAILLTSLLQAEDAAVVANKLIQHMGAPWNLSDEVEITLGASIGIAVFPDHGDNTTVLLQGADAALYKAKAAGRNTFTFYSDAYTLAARDRLTVEAQLRKAIKAGHLRVFYQPQVDILSGRIMGAEALVRWFDPEQGMISPMRFIPIAEACGLINEIGEFVLTETCRQGQQWLEAGLPKLTLAVNVSPAQFKRFDMRKQVTQVLNDTGFPPRCLELELTESALMENQETVVQVLDELRGLGIRLAIDDFGTGYSSLAYLKRFPLDVLKIDKKFIDDIPHSKDDMAIATAIIGIAHSLGFKVLAEGVETAQQLEFLKQQRCDQYQGYFCSPPIPADKFQALLEQQQSKTNIHLVS